MKQMVSTREAYAMAGVLTLVGVFGAVSLVLGPQAHSASDEVSTGTPSVSTPAGVTDGEITEQGQESVTLEATAEPQATETLSSSPSPSDGALAPADQADTPDTTPTDNDSAPAEPLSTPTSEASETTPSEHREGVTVSEQMGIYPLQVGEIEHRVQAGQTLASISADYGISVDALALRNNLQNVHMIYEGSALIVPMTVD